MTSEFTIAVHAIVFLNHKNTNVSSEELAHNVCTNPARIRKVMAKLKKSDLIETKEGKVGGYRFTKAPSQVTLRHIFDSLDTKIIAPSWKSGDQDMDCLIASGMANVLDGIYSNMELLCKEHLSTITIADVDAKIFRNT